MTSDADFQSSIRRGIVVGLIAYLSLAAAGAGIGGLTGSVVAGLAAGLAGGYFVGTTIWVALQFRAFRIAHSHLRAGVRFRPAFPCRDS